MIIIWVGFELTYVIKYLNFDIKGTPLTNTNYHPCKR